MTLNLDARIFECRTEYSCARDNGRKASTVLDDLKPVTITAAASRESAAPGQVQGKFPPGLAAARAC